MLAEAARRARAEGAERIASSRAELEVELDAIGRDAGNVLRQAGRVRARAGAGVLGAPTRGVDAPEDDDDVAEAARTWLMEQIQVPRVHGMDMHTFYVACTQHVHVHVHVLVHLHRAQRAATLTPTLTLTLTLI